MNKKLKQKLLKRFKSFAWRISALAIVVGLSFLLENASELLIPIYVQGIIGLVVGEVTKYLNTSK